MKLLSSAFLTVFLTGITVLPAQDIRFNGLWTGSSVQNQSGPWTWTINLSNLANLQDRRFENLYYPASDIRLQLVNILSYRCNARWSWSLGLHYQRNYPFDDRFSNEFRPFEQAEFRHRISHFSVVHMLRLNQRFIQVRNEDRYSLNHSFQYKTSVSFPLGHSSPHMSWFLDAYSEEYFGIAGPMVFDRLCEFWFNAALACQWSPSNRLSAGIGHEYLIRNRQKEKRIIWYPSVNYTSLIRWRKA